MIYLHYPEETSSLLKKGWNPSSMWHWQCSSPCMAVCTSNPKTKEHHFMPLTYIEWIFRYLLDVKIAGMFDGFTISCVRWNYNFPGPHQHQMIWCPFLSMVPIRKKKEFFPVHQIFPSKGIWCAASADTCQGIKPKSRFGWRGNLKKIFSKTHLTSSLAYLIALQEHNYNVWHMLNNKLPIPESIVFCAFCNIWLIVPPTSVGCWLIVLSHSSEFSSKKKHTT